MGKAIVGMDCGLDEVTLGWAGAAIEQLGEDTVEISQGSVAGDEAVGLELAAFDKLKGAAADGRRVVKGGFERQIAVVKAVGVEAHFGSRFRAAEEVDYAAIANHGDGLFPGFREGDGFDGDIYAALLGGQAANIGDGVFCPSGLDDMRDAERPCHGCLRIVFDDRDYLASGQCGYVHDHETQRTPANYGDGVAWVRVGGLKAM